MITKDDIIRDLIEGLEKCREQFSMYQRFARSSGPIKAEGKVKSLKKILEHENSHAIEYIDNVLSKCKGYMEGEYVPTEATPLSGESDDNSDALRLASQLADADLFIDQLAKALRPLARKKIPYDTCENVGAYSIYHDEIQWAKEAIEKYEARCK